MYFFYYLPIGIDADTRRFPVLTTLFSVLCIVVFILNRYAAGDLPLNFANYIYSPGWSGPGTAVAAMFLHFDYLHLISNLVYLILFGRYLEDRLGPVLFAVVYLGAGFLGNIAQGWHNIHVLQTGAGIIGASGAVSGLMGAFLVLLRHHRVKVAYWVFAPLMATNKAGTSDVHVVFALAIWAVIQIVRGLIQIEGAGTGVAYVTHVAGFAFGLGVVLATGGWKRGAVAGNLVKARRALRRGDFYGAQDELSYYALACPEDGDAHAQLARARAACNDKAGARESYLRACECLLRAGQRGKAEAAYLEASRSFPDFALAPELQLDLCFGLERTLKSAQALKAYETFARIYHDHGEAAFAILRAANLHAREGDTARARACYQRVVEHYPGDEWAEFAAEHARRLGTA